jgi:alkylhydroperoxidase family enzyme
MSWISEEIQENVMTTSKRVKILLRCGLITAMALLVALLILGCADPLRKYRRLDTVSNLTDQTKLAKIAMSNKEPLSVKLAASKKLNDQALLTKVATENEHWEVREAVVSKLNDQILLTKVATEDEHWEVRKAAVLKLTDQAVLTKVATEDEHWEVRKAAVPKLTDQAILTKVATEDEHREVRRMAVPKLTDQAVLTKVATEDEQGSVRQAALLRVTNQAVLTKAFEQDQDLRAKLSAVAGLTDQALMTLVKEAENNSIRLTAVANLTDPKIATNAWDNPHIREFTQLRQFLDDPTTVREVGVSKIIVLQMTVSNSNYRYRSSGRPATVKAEDLNVWVYPEKEKPEVFYSNGQEMIRRRWQSWPVTTPTTFLTDPLDIKAFIRELRGKWNL